LRYVTLTALFFRGTHENGSHGGDDLNLAWHRIDTWPDVVPGFKRLQRKFMLAPCSNGNIALMVDIARPSSFHSTCDDCCKEEER